MTRERKMLWGGGVLLALMLLVEFALLPAVDALDGKEKRVAALSVQKHQLDLLAAQAPSAKQRPAASGEAVTALLPWLERNINRAGLADGLEQISPKTAQEGQFREQAVVRLKEVNLTSLLPFLEQLEQAEALQVVRGVLRRHELRGVDFEAEIGLR